MAINEGRNFSFILYPDSMPENAIEMLLQEQFCVAISPLHYADDETFKPHYHVLLSFSGKQNLSTIDEEMRKKYGCTYVQKVKDRNKYTRYLLHLDNPEKQQFEEGITANYDLRSYLTKDVFVIDIIKEVKERKILSFKDMVNTFTYENRYNELEKIASKGTFFKNYFAGDNDKKEK